MAMMNEVKNELRKRAGSYKTDEDGFYRDTLTIIEQLQAKNGEYKYKNRRMTKEIERLETAKLKIGTIILDDKVLRIERTDETPRGVRIVVTKALKE